MAKRLENEVLDGSLDVLATATTLVVLSAEPTSLADLTTLALASVTIGPGDFAKANGDLSGRKVTIGAQNGLNVTTSGTPNHIGYGTASTFLGATTCTGPALTAGSTVNVPAHDYEQSDPLL